MFECVAMHASLRVGRQSITASNKATKLVIETSVMDQFLQGIFI